MGKLNRKAHDEEAEKTSQVYELQDLTVKEVSLVDSPAIGRHILVTKRHEPEEDEMAEAKKKADEQTEEEKAAAAAAAAAAAEGEVVVEKPKGEEEPTTKAEAPEPLRIEINVTSDVGKGEETTVEVDPIALLADKAETPMQKYLIEALQRHMSIQSKGEVATFGELFDSMNDWDAIYNSLSALQWTILDTIDFGDDGTKVAGVKAAIGDFSKSMYAAMKSLGLKVADESAPTDEKADDEADEAKSDDVGDDAMLNTLTEIATAMAGLGERLGVLETAGKRSDEEATQPGDDEKPTEKSGDKPMTADETLAAIAKAVKEARAPIFKGEGPSDEEPTNEPTEGPGGIDEEVYLPGLGGMNGETTTRPV